MRWFSRPWILLWCVLVLISAGIFTYSETMAFVWDEGFHLVAAQLIAWGKTPYLDFIFPQTLLNAYFNAAVLRFLGHDWHAVHAFDALFVAGAVCLAATYVMRRFPDRRWALPCAIVVACFVGLDTVVVPFGPVAQAYGAGTLLLVAAFRSAIVSVDRSSPWLTFLTALFAGAAAGSTLLTAPALPVFLIWILFANKAGNRRAKFLAFCVGSILPFAPELWLFARDPKVTFFNVVQYQAVFRRFNWGDADSHDFDVFTDWTVSTPALLSGLLTLIGLLFITKRSNWDGALRREYYLAACLAAALGAYISTAHPTFGRYFIFMIPFMAILAGAGFYYAASRLIGPERPRLPAAVLVLILAVSAAKYVYDDRESTNWNDYAKIAAKIKEVTPLGKEYFSDEVVYFLLRQTPPPGMEFSYSHKLELSDKEEARYHIISLKQLKQQVAAGRFQTFETCKDDIVTDFKLDDYFPHKQEFDDCTVFWRKAQPSK